MGYTTEDFEKAANDMGYVIESIHKVTPGEVSLMTGEVIEGNLIRRVIWDADGKCFSCRLHEPIHEHDLALKKGGSR